MKPIEPKSMLAEGTILGAPEKEADRKGCRPERSPVEGNSDGSENQKCKAVEQVPSTDGPMSRLAEGTPLNGEELESSEGAAPILLCKEVEEDAEGTSLRRLFRDQDELDSEESEEESDEDDLIPKCNGSYVDGALNGLKVTYSVDPGAGETMISEKLFNKLPKDRRPEFISGQDYNKNADGSPLKVVGRALFQLQLGPVTLERVCAVGGNEDAILLGDDILRLDPEGPMDVLNSEKVIRFGEYRIPMWGIGRVKRAIRVVNLDIVEIPGMTEQIVEGFVHRDEEDKSAERCLLAESAGSFVDKYHCVVTPAVVDVAEKCATKIRIINPYQNAVRIPPGELLGTLETSSCEPSDTEGREP